MKHDVWASALRRSQGISLPFLPLLPILHQGSEPLMWADAVLCSALWLCTSLIDLPLLLLQAFGFKEREDELPRLYLPPKPTWQATSFASFLIYLVVSIA